MAEVPEPTVAEAGEPWLEAAAARLLESAGQAGAARDETGLDAVLGTGSIDPAAITLRPLAGGANNRVLGVHATGSASSGCLAVLKVYSRHPDDPRDRLGTENAFSSFAWTAGLRCIPRPLACDRELGLGLYSFVDGRRPSREQVDEAAFDQLVAFFVGLNEQRFLPEALALPPASEASFSIPEHVERIDGRVRRLLGIEITSDADHEASQLIDDRLLPAWHRARGLTQSLLDRSETGLGRELGPEQRCISPSDLGFHNALRTPDGRMVFLDFEYGGWDDPARTTCDLFCQPAVPIPQRFMARFTDAVIGSGIVGRDGDHHRARIEALLPVYRIKWICILLNELLPEGRHRRCFAERGDLEKRKLVQLEKARQALDAIDRNEPKHDVMINEPHEPGDGVRS